MNIRCRLLGHDMVFTDYYPMGAILVRGRECTRCDYSIPVAVPKEV
jgi:hypothetical protein